MKKLENLGRSLSKAEQKLVLGGSDPNDSVDPGEGGGTCIRCYSTQGYSSCWYTLGDSSSLCSRVYGGNYFYAESVPGCGGCTMN